MNRKHIVFTLLLCSMIFIFGGCKIQTPDQAAGIMASSEALDFSLSSSHVGASSNEDSSSSPSSGDTASSGENGESAASVPTNTTESSSKPQGGDSPRQSVSSGAPSSKSNSTKDPYQTDPVPDGKPQPTEPQEQNPDKNAVLYCTLLVECKTILNNMNQFNQDKLSVLPADGVIFQERKVMFYEGESVFDVLNREMKKNRIHMEFRATPVYNSNYIMGIQNLYEFDCGDLSGWMFSVNGWYPNYGCSRYTVKEGDVIQWRYTCDLGRDVGCDWLADTKQ